MKKAISDPDELPSSLVQYYNSQTNFTQKETLFLGILMDVLGKTPSHVLMGLTHVYFQSYRLPILNFNIRQFLS